MKKLLKTIADRFDLRDGFMFGGLSLVAIGVAQIYAPAAWIVFGVVLMILAVR